MKCDFDKLLTQSLNHPFMRGAIPPPFPSWSLRSLAKPPSTPPPPPDTKVQLFLMHPVLCPERETRGVPSYRPDRLNNNTHVYINIRFNTVQTRTVPIFGNEGLTDRPAIY